MITLEKLSKNYGTFQVLKNCSTSIDAGEVVVICGPSGSGKSTLIKCVNGLEPFDSGSIKVGDIDVGAPSTDLPKLRAKIGMVFQNFELFPHLTIMDNLVIAQEKVLGRKNGGSKGQGCEPARSGGPCRSSLEVPDPPIRRSATTRGDRSGAGDGPDGDDVR